MTPPVLEVRGLVKRYGPTTVLDGVDLAVDEHEVVTMIGASGSGKSTLLRCVDLLTDVDDGQVFSTAPTSPTRGPGGGSGPRPSGGWRSCSRPSTCSRT